MPTRRAIRLFQDGKRISEIAKALSIGRASVYRAQQGMRFSEHLDGDGETIFVHACKLGLEGIVSKRREFPYRSGRCKSWLKAKNPESPAVMRIQDGSW
jgi:ATP-dependent DNA ligase